MSLRSFTVYDIVKRNGRVFKKRVAIQAEERSITFGELSDQTCASSAHWPPAGSAGGTGSPS